MAATVLNTYLGGSVTTADDGLGFDFHELMASAQEQLTAIGEVQRRRAQLVAHATVADRTVTVHVNAQGVVIKTEIDPDFLDEYDFEDLAGFVTEAAQQAAANVARQGEAMMESIRKANAALPSLSEVLDGAPDLRDFAITPEQISTAPPGSTERSTAPHPGAGRWT
ncbi:YbaB/EbfC family nucleoid-associated protein [Gordonia sp. DT219]|uniref:YbaB/EbfC family nucleoid-associated protein n=1 Tax=Gordonia sp. DT219 TaxID=3416658 RepID=UPI003CE71CD1